MDNDVHELGVFVLGTGQCGTSAASRLIHLLGLPISDDRDVLAAPAPDNQKGYWESAALIEVNEALLTELGGTRRAGPSLAPGWELSPSLHSWEERGREVFRAVYRTPQWVWKDPRNAMTLPFWRRILPGDHVGIVVTRNPLEVVASLQRQLACTKRYALARWEQRTRDLLAGAVGLPVLFTRFEDLTEHPREWVSDAKVFLERHGAIVTQPTDSAVLEFVDPALRHTRFTAAQFVHDAVVSDEQRELWRLVTGLTGQHASLDLPPLPPMTEWAAAVLDEYRSEYIRDLEASVGWLESERVNLTATVEALSAQMETLLEKRPLIRAGRALSMALRRRLAR